MSLGAVTVVAGVLLGGMYSLTKEPIALQQSRQRVAAIKDVAPDFDNDPLADCTEVSVDGQTFRIFPAFRNGSLAGAAVQGSTMNGFSGEITLMCGFDADGTIRDYRVLSQAETPGLGARMEMWFRDPAGARNIIGRNPAHDVMYVNKDPGGTVDGITAATISSRAFLEIVRSAYEAYRTASESHGRKLPHVAEAGKANASSGASTQLETQSEK